MIYLDNSATTRVLPEAMRAVEQFMCDLYFNPSSAYGPAISVERSVEEARGRLAKALGASQNEIFYTSGGTESNNMAIEGTLKNARCKKIITTAVEHPSVYDVYKRREMGGSQVCYAGVNAAGEARLDQIDAMLTKDTALVSVMHVNNETGAINDIERIYGLIKGRAPQALLHVDGVQAFCKLPFGKRHCDLYSISGHKFHGPKGVGALYVRAGIAFAGGQIGGGQERGMRSGTTNTPGIMGMDAAIAAYQQNQSDWVNAMRACKLRLAANIGAIGDTLVNGPSPENGAPHILNISIMGVNGEVLLGALSQRGILVSTGSACAARKKGKNRVLLAMGVCGDRQAGAVRFSLCPFLTFQEIDEAASVIADVAANLRKYKRR